MSASASRPDVMGAAQNYGNVPRCDIEQLEIQRPANCLVRPHLKHSNIAGLGSVLREMNYVYLAVRTRGLSHSVDMAPRDSAYSNYIEL
jgi:hypothetical protein